MRATVGDMLVVRGHRQGEPDRMGEVMEVHGTDGGPPFLVRWDDDGHVGLVFPGPDATVEKIEHARRRTRVPAGH
ncbi:MAG TPA: DUF1918 domain-containing protein [Acidimicrobiales bacterium]|nr:DUF1918 domain-containing protein [Acidimicrobiales bacterium]